MTCLKTKNSRFWLWGNRVQTGPFSWACVPTKVHFFSLEEQLPQNVSSSNKVCLFIPSICLCVPYCLWWFSCNCRLFLLSLFTEKKSSLSLHPSQIALWCLWSCLLPLSLEKSPGTLSYVALERFTEHFLFLIVRILYFNQLKWAISLNTCACQHPQYEELSNSHTLLVRWVAVMLNSGILHSYSFKLHFTLTGLVATALKSTWPRYLFTVLSRVA